MKNWTDIGSDVNWPDYGGAWARKARDGSWFVVQFTNMDGACGSDNEGHDTYLAEVRRVDPSDVSAEDIQRAMDSCGSDTDDDPSEIAIVAALNGYGHYAPLGSHSGNSYPDRVRAAARREAEEYMRDAVALDSALDRPVNKIGSTAREYARGDINSAIERGVKAGDLAAMIMRKMGVR